MKNNNKITLAGKTYLSINKGMFDNELLDRNDFIRANGKVYYLAIKASKVHTDKKLMAL